MTGNTKPCKRCLQNIEITVSRGGGGAECLRVTKARIAVWNRVHVLTSFPPPTRHPSCLVSVSCSVLRRALCCAVACLGSSWCGPHLPAVPPQAKIMAKQVEVGDNPKHHNVMFSGQDTASFAHASPPLPRCNRSTGMTHCLLSDRTHCGGGGQRPRGGAPLRPGRRSCSALRRGVAYNPIPPLSKQRKSAKKLQNQYLTLFGFHPPESLAELLQMHCQEYGVGWRCHKLGGVRANGGNEAPDT